MATTVINDYFENIARGKYLNKSHVYKFGNNKVVGTSEVIVWNAGVTYTYLSTGVPIEILSSSADDTLLGSGARKVHIFGLDNDFNAIDEIVEMNGVTPVTLKNSYRRVFRAFVVSSGTYLTLDGANVGNLSIRTVTGSTMQAYIAGGTGQTLMALFTIPKGYTGYIWTASATTGKGKDITATIKTKANDNGGDAPFRVRASRDLYQNSFIKAFKIPIKVLEKTDIAFTGLSSVGSSPMSASFEIELIKN